MDPGEGNEAAVAEHVTTGEGNRLGRGPRCSYIEGGAELTERSAKRLAGRTKDRTTRGRNNARCERVATYVLRLGELDHAAGRLKHLALSAIWRREVGAEHARLSTVSRKTTRIDRLAEYHAVAGEVAEKCWENRSKRRISRAAFGFWSRQVAAADRFWSTVLRGRACDGTANFDGVTMLAYGDGKWGGGRGPHKLVYDSAVRVFGRENVIKTDEYLTSQMHHGCGDKLQDVVDAHKNYKTRGGHACATERSLKRCARTSCSSWHDRDVNVRNLHARRGGRARTQARRRAGGATNRPPHPDNTRARRLPSTSSRSDSPSCAARTTDLRICGETPSPWETRQYVARDHHVQLSTCRVYVRN
jgi:hypothetical protein